MRGRRKIILIFGILIIISIASYLFFMPDSRLIKETCNGENCLNGIYPNEKYIENPPPGFCGNNLIEEEETTENCCEDVGCLEGQTCVENRCIDLSNDDADNIGEIFCEEIIKMGDSSKNLDILFVPDNINNLDEFKEKLNLHIEGILSVEPFKSKKNIINFYFLDVNEDFGFSTEENNQKKVESFVQYCDYVDEIILLVGEEENNIGGAGEHFAWSVITEPWKTLHEFGHSFGGFYDTYSGWILFDGNPRVLYQSNEEALLKMDWNFENLSSNVDNGGCSKWCQSHTGVYQTSCTQITNEEQCRHHERELENFLGVGDKWSCKDLLTCCVWLPKPDPFFGTNCVNFRDNKDIGIGCIGNSGCFYGANGQVAWRSVKATYENEDSTNSIMNDNNKNIWDFGDVEIGILNKVFDCCYPQNCNDYPQYDCQELSKKYRLFKNCTSCNF